MNGDPLYFRSAIKQDHTNWHPTIRKEIVSLRKKGTFKIIFLPPGKSAIGCRSVFKIKEELVQEEETKKATESRAAKRNRDRIANKI